MEKQHKFSMWYIILGIWVVLIIHNYLASAFAIQAIPYSEFLKLLKEQKITDIAIKADTIQGRMLNGDADQGGGTLFKTVRVDTEISALLDKYDVSFKGEIESTFLRDLFSWLLPVFLFFGIWYLLFQRLAGK